MIAERPIVLPNDDGIRPAGKPNACFYCDSKVGEPHGEECVAVHKRVRVRYIMEIEIEVPAHWGQHEVEFHRNDSSWCANNARNDVDAYVEYIETKYEKMPEAVANALPACLCNQFQCEVVNMGDGVAYTKVASVETAA